MQRLLQPLHRLPEDQDEQRDAAEWRPGKPLLSGPGPGPQCVPHQESGMLLHPPPPSYASADCLSAAQTPSSMSGSISPHGQIVVPASALQQGNVTMTTVNPTQVVAGMSSWHTTSPSGTAVIPAAHTLTGARGSAEGSCGAQNITLLPVSPPPSPLLKVGRCISLLQSSLLRVRWSLRLCLQGQYASRTIRCVCV